jgi:hypothetical protein
VLSFIYDFYQMIVGNVSLFVQTSKNALQALTTAIPNMTSFVSDCGFPPIVLALFGLIVGLALFDKIVEVVS